MLSKPSFPLGIVFDALDHAENAEDKQKTRDSAVERLRNEEAERQEPCHDHEVNCLTVTKVDKLAEQEQNDAKPEQARTRKRLHRRGEDQFESVHGTSSCSGLTKPSSATGHGDARLDHEKRRTAMARSLERVVIDLQESSMKFSARVDGRLAA